VLIFSGIALFNKPHLYGGDKKGALKKFKSAYNLSSTSSKPYWGKWDAHYWYAISLIQQDEKENADEIIRLLIHKFPQNKEFKKLLNKS